MKGFFYFLFIVFIVLGLLILGNMLRCMGTRGTVCPGWCYPKKVQCLGSECETKLACQAPGWNDYISLTENWWEDQKNEWQKK